MPNFTPNFNWYLPLVNDSIDADLWGGFLNANTSSLDTLFFVRNKDYNFAGFKLIQAVLQYYTELVQSAGNISGSVTIDFSLGNHYSAVLTGNVTFAYANPPPAGQAIPLLLYLKQDGTGNRSITFPASTVWAGGILPTNTKTAGRTDQFVLITIDGGTTYSGSIRGLNYIM